MRDFNQGDYVYYRYHKRDENIIELIPDYMFKGIGIIEDVSVIAKTYTYQVRYTNSRGDYSSHYYDSKSLTHAYTEEGELINE